MQRLLLVIFALIVSFALPISDADARRLGGGKSYGMQRSAPMQRDVSPSRDQGSQTSPGNIGAQPGKRNWLGPIAGLAAGIGLAALFSHLGMGEGMANVLMLALLAFAAIALVRWFVRRNAPQPMQYAGQGNPPMHFEAPAGIPGSPTGNIQPAFPPGFDAAAFTRQAKVNFLRLQAANDACNLDDLREFTTPEMYAELKLDIDERNGAIQKTEVVELAAEVLEAIEEGTRNIVSVRFHGLILEDAGEPAPFDEIWHLTSPARGGGWVVAGIQQHGSAA